MKKLKIFVWIFSALLVFVGLAGVVWLSEQDNTKRHVVNIASYQFSATLDGDTTSADQVDNFKGVEFTAEHVTQLQQNGSAAWPITVKAGADQGIELDYLMFFDPFYTESVWGAADITAIPVDAPESCTNTINATSDNANMFYTQRAVESEGADNPTEHHYCVVAQAPTNPEKLSIFMSADAAGAEPVVLNIRHTAK